MKKLKNQNNQNNQNNKTMADNNKMFFGTNKDTYIAADDAGNIILQTEHPHYIE